MLFVLVLQCSLVHLFFHSFILLMRLIRQDFRIAGKKKMNKPVWGSVMLMMVACVFANGIHDGHSKLSSGSRNPCFGQCDGQVNNSLLLYRFISAPVVCKAYAVV